MKRNKANLNHRTFNVLSKEAFTYKPQQTFQFASVCNGHSIHLRHRIDPGIFSVQQEEAWPTKAVLIPDAPKRLWRLHCIRQMASACKLPQDSMAVTTKPMLNDQGE